MNFSCDSFKFDFVSFWKMSSQLTSKVALATLIPSEVGGTSSSLITDSTAPTLNTNWIFVPLGILLIRDRAMSFQRIVVLSGETKNTSTVSELSNSKLESGSLSVRDLYGFSVVQTLTGEPNCGYCSSTSLE